MPDDVRTVLHRAAATDAAGADTAAIAARARQLRRGRRLAAAAAAALVPLAVLAGVTVPDRVQVGFAERPSTTVLEVPDQLDAPAPGFLEDGTPVFVVNLGDEGVHVLDARSPHRMYGFEVLIGWCESSGWFEEWPSGSRFSADGRYQGGPAPTGLVSYEVDDLDDGRIRVGGPLPAPERNTETVAPRLAEPRGPGCDAGATEDEPFARTRAHYLDRLGRAPAPEEAVGQQRSGRVLVEGSLELRDGVARLCGATVPADEMWWQDVRPRCGPGDLEMAVDHEALREAAEGWLHGWQGLIIAELRDGALVGATITAATLEYLGYTHGEYTLHGTLRPLDDPPDAWGVVGDFTVDTREFDLFVDAADGEAWALVLGDDTAVVGRERLAAADAPTPVDHQVLHDAAARGDRVPLEITVRRTDQTIVRIEEVPD